MLLKQFLSFSYVLVTLHIDSALCWRSMPMVLEYGQPCSLESNSSTNMCNPSKNLECSNTISHTVCDCKKAENQEMVYDRETKACFTLPRTSNSFACKTTSECRASSYGIFSRCNPTTKRCECYDEKQEVKLVEVGNSCYSSRSVPFAGNPVPTYECATDADCIFSPLRELTRCNLATKTCECFCRTTNGKLPVAVYNGKCVYVKRLQDFCNNDDECRVGYHVNAICSVHENYLASGEKVCVCPENINCDGDYGGGATATTLKIQLGFLHLLFVTVGMRMFFFSSFRTI